MTAMPTGATARGTVQTPEGFLTECQRRGIKLTSRAGAIKATGKPPANPEKFAVFLKSKKPELLALLQVSPVSPPCHGGGHSGDPKSSVKAQLRDSLNYVKPKSKLSLLGELDQVGSESPLQALQLRQVATKSASELGEVGRESPLAEALYPAGDSRQEVLCWAVSEAKKGTLPELAEPLLLGVLCPSHRKGIVGRFLTPCADGNQMFFVGHRWAKDEITDFLTLTATVSRKVLTDTNQPDSSRKHKGLMFFVL